MTHSMSGCVLVPAKGPGSSYVALGLSCIIALIRKREGLNIKECSQLPVLCSKNLSGLRQ